jgi:hypothetical protein
VWLAIPVAVIGYTLVYAGLKGVHPWCPFLQAFGTPCPPAPGSTSPLAGGGVSPGPGPTPPGGSSGAAWIPPGFPSTPFCGTPPGMVTVGGVQLQAPAMDAYRAAVADMNAHGGPQTIIVVSSYRTCKMQCVVCDRHCQGGCQNGCPGTCAKPGTSYHQLGLAIDVTNYQQALPFLTAHGWCHPLPGSDPGHFSYGGCG